jgi:hypothetical protein
MPGGQAVNKGPKPDPLHHAGNGQAVTFKRLNIREYHLNYYTFSLMRLGLKELGIVPMQY